MNFFHPIVLRISSRLAASAASSSPGRLRFLPKSAQDVVSAAVEDNEAPALELARCSEEEVEIGNEAFGLEPDCSGKDCPALDDPERSPELADMLSENQQRAYLAVSCSQKMYLDQMPISLCD